MHDHNRRAGLHDAPAREVGSPFVDRELIDEVWNAARKHEDVAGGMKILGEDASPRPGRSWSRWDGEQRRVLTRHSTGADRSQRCRGSAGQGRGDRHRGADDARAPPRAHA